MDQTNIPATKSSESQSNQSPHPTPTYSAEVPEQYVKFLSWCMGKTLAETLRASFGQGIPDWLQQSINSMNSPSVIGASPSPITKDEEVVTLEVASPLKLTVKP